mmetsp:Transcript_33030/g.56429  ORF Transcript_33030/g.56429 Transcript_33030/m.56429 type:complete len:213 (-) Transcript_33030:193-831(-)
MPVCFRLRAKSAATLPSQSTRVRSAPKSHSSRTISSRPLLHANMRAVCPRLLARLTAAPKSSSMVPLRVAPIVLASMSAVTPAGLVWSTSALRSMRSSAHKSWSWMHAYLSGVSPTSSTALASAPASRSRWISPTLPFKQAFRMACITAALLPDTPKWVSISSPSSAAHISNVVLTLWPRAIMSASYARVSFLNTSASPPGLSGWCFNANFL